MANVQSPINIKHNIIPLLKTHPQLSIPNVKLVEFENLGLMVEVMINGTMIFEGKMYSLKQYHFHTPAKYLIDAQFYPMEVHFINIVSGKVVELRTIPTSTKF